MVESQALVTTPICNDIKQSPTNTMNPHLPRIRFYESSGAYILTTLLFILYIATAGIHFAFDEPKPYLPLIAALLTPLPYLFRHRFNSKPHLFHQVFCAWVNTSVYSAEKLLASALGLIDDDKLNDSRVDEGVYEELEERNSNADTESLPDVPVSPHNDDVNLPTKFSESIDDDDDDESVPIITTCFKDSMNGFTSAFVSDDEKQPLHSQKEEDLEASKEVDTDERDSKATLVNKDAEEGNHEDEDVQDDVAEEGQGLEVKLENDSSHENADMDELVHKAVPEGVDEVRSAKNVALDAVVQDDNVDEGISEDKDVNEETVEKETVPEAVPENVMIQGVRLGEQVVRDDVLNNEDSYDASKDILEDSGEDNDVHEAVPEVKITPVEPPKDQVIHEAVPVKRDNDTGSDGNKHVAEPVSEGAAIKESPPKGDTITQVLPGETVLHQNPEPPSIEAPLHEAPSKSEAHFREQTSRNAPPKIEFKDNEPPTAFGSFAQGFSASNSPSRYSISSTSTTSTPSKDSRSSKYGRHSREKPIYPKRSTSYRSVDEFAKKGMAVMNPLKNEFQLPSVPIFKKSTVPCASPFKTDKHVTAKFPDVHKLYCKKPQFTLGRSIPVLPPSDDDLVVLSSRTSREFSAPAKVYTYNHDECSFDLQQYSGTLRVVEDQQYSGERHTHVAIFKKTDVGGQECAFQVPISMQTVFRLVTSMSCVIDTVVDSEKYTFIIRFHKVGASKKFHDAVMLAKYFLFISTRTAKN
uniref:GRAM domain-containing protein n=1 Tax=Panagrellus redivivus TaxID=6233 RepID=A0A7E4VIH7_PANRE